jgi:hypothetical protein
MTDADKVLLLQFDREVLVDLLVEEIQSRYGSERKDAVAAIERELFDRRRSAGIGESPTQTFAKRYTPR